ncbi:MAG: DUF2807 domain-containing protein [Bacteroidales bacterium]|nr:DUF2807 domain-containing protein [Bacteroidales bacterium]
MQLNKFLGFVLALTLMLILQSGCSYGFGGIKGNGNVVKQDREISSFSALEVGGAFRVFLKQGDREAITVEADENLLDVISTEVRGRTLEIKTTEDIHDSEVLNIYLTFTSLEKMDISGACKLTGEEKMRFGDLEIECSGASDVELKMAAGNLDLDFSGASQIELYGSAELINLDLSGASSLDAFELEARKYDADVSGASHAKIAVSDELAADVSGAASIKYKGDPTITDFDVSGAGSLKKY